MRTTVFKKVIDAIEEKRYNESEVVKNLAKEYPEIFLEMIQDSEEDWIKEVRKVHRGNNKVECITLCRNISGMGLKQAKEAVERDFEFVTIKKW